jgi:hypothetical protein
MLALRHIGAAAIAIAFVLATAAIDSAEARRSGGGGGMRGGGGFSAGGGMRAGSIGGGSGFAGKAHPSHPIARPGVGRPGWGNTPGTRPPNWAGRPGYGYRPGYGWGAAAAGAAVVGAGLAYGAYPYYGDGYNDEGYAPQVVEQGDPIAECARRFKTYDPASQTYIVRKGVRVPAPRRGSQLERFPLDMGHHVYPACRK